MTVVPEPSVHLKSNYYSVGEGEGTLEVCAEVTTNQFDGNFQVKYVTIGGSAKGVWLIMFRGCITFQ